MKGLEHIQRMNIDAEDIENHASFFQAAKMREEDFVEKLGNNYTEIWNSFIAWQATPPPSGGEARERPEPAPREAAAPRDDIPVPNLAQIDSAQRIRVAAQAVKETASVYWRGIITDDGAFDSELYTRITALDAAIQAFPASP